MNPNELSSRRRRWLVAAIAIIVGLYWLRDPNGSETNDLSWNEVVVLASGETLKVRRHVRFYQEGIIGRRSLSAPNYEKASLEWTAANGERIRWSAPVAAMAIERDPVNGEWIVVADQGNGSMWSVNGQPCPPYWAFRSRAGTWYVQPLPEWIIGRSPNLLLDLHRADDRRFIKSSFSAVAERRKARQSTDPEVINSLLKIGGMRETHPCRKTPQSPRFTGEFTPDRTNRPTLASFPRLP